MLIRWLLAATHLLGLAVGLGAVWTRARALKGVIDPPAIRRILQSDAWWGVAALIWLSTGLVRAFSGLEKGSDYYLSNHLFLTKMGLFVIIVALELRPAMTFRRWRGDLASGRQPDVQDAAALGSISTLQAVLVIVMVFLATGMARGFGS